MPEQLDIFFLPFLKLFKKLAQVYLSDVLAPEDKELPVWVTTSSIIPRMWSLTVGAWGSQECTESQTWGTRSSTPAEIRGLWGPRGCCHSPQPGNRLPRRPPKEADAFLTTSFPQQPLEEGCPKTELWHLLLLFLSRVSSTC